MKRLIGCMAVFCLAALLAAMTVGCGGASSSGTLAYVSNSTGTGFTVFRVTNQGLLTDPTQQNTPAPPKQLQISAVGKWAFFLDASGNNIYGFTRSGNGNFVNPITGSPFQLTSPASSIVIAPKVAASGAPDSKFLYAAIPATNEIAIFQIDQSTGELSQLPAPGSPKAVGAAIQQLAIAPDGLALYGLAPTQEEVVGIFLDPALGTATVSNSPGPVGTNPPCKGLIPPSTCEGMILSADGNFIYVPDTIQTDALGAVIYGFSTKTNGIEGALQQIPPVIFHEQGVVTTPIAGATSNDNRWLFIANRDSHNISVFDIHTFGGGNPQEVGGVAPSPFDCGTFALPEVSCTAPTFIALPKTNPTNAILVLDTHAARIFQIAVDPGKGVLRPLSPHSVDAGPTPTWITIK